MSNDKSDDPQADGARNSANDDGEALTPSPQPSTGKSPAVVDDQKVASPQFKDRSTALVVFGILQIVMGCCCALLVPMMLLSTLDGRATGAPTDARMMIPAVGMYVMLAVLLVWLGVGSILARRWARALTLVLSWMWLVVGLLSLITMSFVMPNILNMTAQDPKVPPQTMIFVQAVMLGTMGCLYLILPGIFVAFYQSRHVKATCDVKDPHVRWTDNCPLPVLSLSLLLGYGAFSMIFTASYGFVMPFFGFLLKGLPGALVTLAISLLFAYLAWATYKLKMAAWWTTLVVYLLFGLSGMITFSRITMMDFYREMKMPEEQLKFIERSGIFEQLNLPLMTGMGMVVVVGYMLWVRRYFIGGSASHEGA